MKRILIATAIVAAAAFHGQARAEESKQTETAAAPTPAPKRKGPIDEIKLLMNDEDKAAFKEIFSVAWNEQKDADEAGKKAAAVKATDAEIELLKKVVARAKAEGAETAAKAQEELDTFIVKYDEMVQFCLNSWKPRPTPAPAEKTAEDAK